MCLSRLVSQPTALIGGSTAALLARVLDSPRVRAYLAAARWAHGEDMDAAIAALRAAGREWEMSLHLPQRDTSPRSRSDPQHCAWTVEQAAEHLHLSIRRVQELARENSIEGRRIGQRWELDPTSVAAYQHHRQQKRTAA